MHPNMLNIIVNAEQCIQNILQNIALKFAVYMRVIIKLLEKIFFSLMIFRTDFESGRVRKGG